MALDPRRLASGSASSRSSIPARAPRDPGAGSGARRPYRGAVSAGVERAIAETRALPLAFPWGVFAEIAPVA